MFTYNYSTAEMNLENSIRRPTTPSVCENGGQCATNVDQCCQQTTDYDLPNYSVDTQS